jgi:hypothetical protein
MRLTLTAPERSLAAQYDLEGWMSTDPPPWNRERHFGQIDGIRELIGKHMLDAAKADDPKWVCSHLELLLLEDEDFIEHVVDTLAKDVNDEQWRGLCTTASRVIVRQYGIEVREGTWPPANVAV